MKSGKATDWTDVADDQGHASMREVIVLHVTALLKDLPKRRNLSEKITRSDTIRYDHPCVFTRKSQIR